MNLSLPSPAFWRSKTAFCLFLLLIGLCYFPIPNHSLSTDDYQLYQVLKGSEALSELGLSNTDPSNSLFNRLANAFNFFSGQQGNLKELQDYGAMPWWTDANSQMVMFRPLAALTHWVDFQLFDKNVYLIQLHSMVWFLFLAWSVFRFYKVVLKEQYGLVFLASVLYLLDYSHLYNFPWLAARNSYMAVAFACWCLYFHHVFAEKGRYINLFASLSCLALALLTAEAGVAVSAYLFAYAVTIDRRSWFKGLISIIPAAIVVVVWRLIYSALAFGSKGIGLYVDPLYSPLEFIETLLLNFGVLALAQVTGIDASLMSIDPAKRFYFQIPALLFSFLCLVFIIKPLKRLPFMQFCLIGSLISIIPFCALTYNNPRSLFFCALGFFPIVAFLLQMLWQRTSSKLSRPFVVLIVLIFIIMPVVGKVNISFNLPLVKTDVNEDTPLNHFKKGGGSNKQGIVYLTYPGGLALYLPYTWDWYGETTPQHIYQFAPGLNSYTLFRESSYRFILTSQSQFVLSPQSPLVKQKGVKPMGDIAYAYQTMHSMTSRPKANFKAGDKFEFAAYNVTVLSAEQGEVTQFQIDFAPSVDMDDLEWRYWDWQQKRFAAVDLLPVGESLFVASKWDL